MVIFHSYVSLPEGKPPFSYGFPMVFLWFSYGFMVLLRFCYPIPMTWQVVPWWPSPGACEPGRSRNIAWCHLQQMPVKQMPIIVSHLHGICIPHTHAYVYIKTYTLYIYTHYTYTHYINICRHTYIYLTHTHIYTHIYIYIYTHNI